MARVSYSGPADTEPEAPLDLVLAGSVLTPDGVAPRLVGVGGAKIIAIEQLSDDALGRLAAGAELIRLADDEVLIPGLVDSHVHINEPGRTEWEGFTSATAAAAAGGVTTILDMPLNSIPATTRRMRCGSNASRPKASARSTWFWGGVVPATSSSRGAARRRSVRLQVFPARLRRPRVPPLSAEQLHQAMTELAAFDGLLIVHCEDPDDPPSAGWITPFTIRTSWTPGLR